MLSISVTFSHLWQIEKAVFDHLQEENPNLYSCLVDAGLVSTDYGVVSWWFENILDVASTKKHKTGLRGEYLSKEYEIKRITRAANKCFAGKYL